MDIDDVMKGALEMADRREMLCKSVPPCVCGEKNQIQLVEWGKIPAIWRCRICHSKYEFEPAEK